MNKTFILALFLGLAISGCTLTPTYQRPAAPVASTWPESAAAANNGTNTTADIGWREFFNDTALRQLIAPALTNNRDLRVAVLNVEAARARYRIQRSELLPHIDASAALTRQRLPGDLLVPGESAVNSRYSVGAGITSYELDLFGRVQSLKSEALENYFATEEARRAAQISLVAEVANQYLAWVEATERLAVASNTLETVQASYELNRQSYNLGNASGLDLRSAEAQVQTARVSAANYAMQRDQAQHALILLIGGPLPDGLAPAQPLSASFLAPLPAGLPSDLLRRRPDILEAEHQLKAANANIGAARAAFFPAIRVTANAGLSSDQLSSLFAGGSGAWLFNPQITMPIFEAGENKANLEAANAGKGMAIANYEKAIQTAFREVADALTARASLETEIGDQEKLVQAEQSRYDLADARYRGGVDNYLAALAAQQDLYNAQQNLVALYFSRLSNWVNLYEALGGGWLENSAQASGVQTGSELRP